MGWVSVMADDLFMLLIPGLTKVPCSGLRSLCSYDRTRKTKLPGRFLDPRKRGPGPREARERHVICFLVFLVPEQGVFRSGEGES